MGWFTERAEARHIEHMEYLAKKKKAEAILMRIAEMHGVVQMLEFENNSVLLPIMKKILIEYAQAHKEVMDRS